MAKVKPTVKKAVVSSGSHLVDSITEYLAGYVILPKTSIEVIAVWVVAAWAIDVWDRFPHLYIYSPEKGCGKTTLLQMLRFIVPRPLFTSNISVASVYRIVALEKPTIIMDESQSLKRQSSDKSRVMVEMMNSAIEKDMETVRMGGEGFETPRRFSTYSPKIFAHIDSPDEVLADRSLVILMERMTSQETVKQFFSRKVKPQGEAIAEQIETWCTKNEVRLSEQYMNQTPLPLKNKRMRDMLAPLQACLTVARHPLGRLQHFAFEAAKKDLEQEMQSPGVQLLGTCKTLFEKREFVATAELINELRERDEENWNTCNNGRPITSAFLASTLRKYGIKPDRKQKKMFGKVTGIRGYYRDSFKKAWAKYLRE